MCNGKKFSCYFRYDNSRLFARENDPFSGPLKKQLTEVGKKVCLFVWRPNEFSSLIKQSVTLLEEK